MGGRAGAHLRSVRSVNLRHDARYHEPRSRNATKNRSTLLPQSFGTLRAALTPFARHRDPVPENRPKARVRCLTRCRAQRLRRVVCTSCASKPYDFRERILPTGGRRVQWLRLRGSATFIETRMASCSRRQHSLLRSRHRKQLLPLRRTTRGSTRQDAECRARRPSRLVQR